MNICIDIDGTLIASEHYLPYFNEYFGKNIKRTELKVYDFRELFDVSEEEIRIFYDTQGHKMQLEAELLEHAKDVLEKLKDMHNLSIITARKEDSITTSQEWLKINDIDWIPLHATGDPDKLDIARRLNCDIFIEDHPTFSLKAAQAGIKVILMDAVYNRELKHENIYRAFTWEDVERFICSF